MRNILPEFRRQRRTVGEIAMLLGVSRLTTTLAKAALRGFRSYHPGAGPCPAAHRAGDSSVFCLSTA
jgi:hypothetical protein